MIAAAERALLTRADDLADTTDLAAELIEIIGWARAARVDAGALSSLVTAVRLLGGDIAVLVRAMRGHHTSGKFRRDTELLDITAEAEDGIAGRDQAVRQLRLQVETALARARAAEAAAAAALSRARQMPVTEPCRGCHPAREQAITAVQRELDDARERRHYANAALEVLAPLKLAEALRAVRRLPDDLHEVYEAAYDLVTRDPRAMPKDGDFITGEATSAAMAARMLAARVPASGRRPVQVREDGARC